MGDKKCINACALKNNINISDLIFSRRLHKDLLLEKWIDNLSVEDAKRMNIKKDFDLSTGNIVKTFGDYFKPKTK